MKLQLLSSFKFWKKFLKYISLGVCLLLVSYLINDASLKGVNAQEYYDGYGDGTTDTTFVSYPDVGDGTSDTTYISYPYVGDGTTDSTYMSYPYVGDGTADTTYISYPYAGDGTTDSTYISYPGYYQPTQSGSTTTQSPYITYEGGDCYSNHSYWVKEWSDGYKDWVADHGVVPGECGNPLVSDSAQTGGQWIQMDPECDWNTQQVYDVQWNNVTGQYNKYNYHYQAGACGYQDSYSQPTQPSSQPSYGQYSVKFICEGNYSECGNNVGTPYSEQWGTYMSVADPYPGCNKTVQIDTFTKYCRDGSGTWICGPNDLVNFNVWYSGACEVPQLPVEQPVTYYPPQQPPYYPPIQPPYFPPYQPPYIPPYQPPVYPYFPTQPIVPQYPVQPIQPVRPQQPVVQQYPAPVAQVPSTNNNYNYNNNTSNSYSNAYQTQEQTVNIPPVQVITAVAPQPVSQVAGLSYIKQLPSTGLPLAAWAAASFIPVGLKFRKFAKGKLEDGMTANFLWEEKQFKTGYSG